MGTNKMREQFEAWISSYIGSTWLKRNDHQMDEYLDENAQFMWEAWQASRAALVVEIEQIRGKRIKWLILPLHESETDRHLIGLSG